MSTIGKQNQEKEMKNKRGALFCFVGRGKWEMNLQK